MANIKDKITQIRQAIYGKEIRESIASGIESINTEVESTTERQRQVETRQTNLENTFNAEIENAISENPSSVETVAARTDNINNKTYQNLPERLDDFASQLAEMESKKVYKIEGKGLSTNDYDNFEKAEVAKIKDKADKTQINELELKKADKAFVDSQFAAIVSGAPKGTYPTVSDLQAAYPTGAEGVFLVLADGHWYYWNSITLAWTDGGVYQATQIEDHSIFPTKLTEYIGWLFPSSSQKINIDTVNHIITMPKGFYVTIPTINASNNSPTLSENVVSWATDSYPDRLVLFYIGCDTGLLYVISQGRNVYTKNGLYGVVSDINEQIILIGGYYKGLLDLNRKHFTVNSVGAVDYTLNERAYLRTASLYNYKPFNISYDFSTKDFTISSERFFVIYDNGSYENITNFNQTIANIDTTTYVLYFNKSTKQFELANNKSIEGFSTDLVKICSMTISSGSRTISYMYPKQDNVYFNGAQITEKSKTSYGVDGVFHFTVDVNAYAQDVVSDTLSVQDGIITLKDYGVLFLPKNYSAVGKPTRLIINCHGAGTTITGTTSALSNPVMNMVKLGYAVMDMNGIPYSLSDSTGLHFGAPIALQSYLKGYEYVVNNFNVSKEVFVMGTSMGGLTSNMLVQSGCIPVIAQASFCGVVDHFKQAWCNPWSSGQREKIANLFGFTGNAPSFTATGYPTEAEIQYYKDNIDKVIGYNPIMKNTFNWNSALYDNYGDSTEETEYNALIKYHPVPIKIWHNEDDPTVLPRYSEYFVKAIRNAGGLAFLRKFPSGGHNAWDNGDTITMTDIEGNSFSVKASTYELYQWFKRFEG